MADADALPAAVLAGTGGAAPFRVHRQPPSAAADDVVQHLWVVDWDLPDGAAHTQEVLTLPCHHVTVEPDGCWVQGVVTRRFARTLTGRGRAVGAALRVPGLAALTGADDLSATTDQRLPLLGLLPGAAQPEIERAGSAADAATALDAWLAARPRRPVPHGDLAEQAVALAQADPGLTRVEDLAARLAVSPRTLQRHLGRVLGVSPKWVVQRARIHDALEQAGRTPPDWGDLAHRLGFADQAHFTNTFTAMVGVPPARYLSRAAAPTPPATPPSPSSR